MPETGDDHTAGTAPSVDEEVARRRDEAIRRALTMPPKPKGGKAGAHDLLRVHPGHGNPEEAASSIVRAKLAASATAPERHRLTHPRTPASPVLNSPR